MIKERKRTNVALLTTVFILPLLSFKGLRRCRCALFSTMSKQRNPRIESTRGAPPFVKVMGQFVSLLGRLSAKPTTRLIKLVDPDIEALSFTKLGANSLDQIRNSIALGTNVVFYAFFSSIRDQKQSTTKIERNTPTLTNLGSLH